MVFSDHLVLHLYGDKMLWSKYYFWFDNKMKENFGSSIFFSYVEKQSFVQKHWPWYTILKSKRVSFASICLLPLSLSCCTINELILLSEENFWHFCVFHYKDINYCSFCLYEQQWFEHYNVGIWLLFHRYIVCPIY